jgi:hypothetical protein
MAEPIPLPVAPKRNADSAMYQRVFIQFAEGATVLEDLVARFHDRPVFVAGGLEGSRQTDFNAGKQAVIRFLLKQLNQLPDEPEDADV